MYLRKYGVAVKSHEARKRESVMLIWWVIGAVAVLLLIYGLVECVPVSGGGGVGPLLGAGVGASLTYMLTRRQRREEESQRRRALATGLLSEIRLLYIVLNAIYRSGELHMEAIEPFHTAMYDQAGSELLRFTPKTVDSLTYFYQLVHTLQMELNRFRVIPVDLRQWHNAALRVRATQAALAIKDTVRLLTDEGGVRPRPFPSFTITGYPPVGPDFPPSVFPASEAGDNTG